MECPACKTLLEEVTIEGIALDVCKKGCGGIWFDRFELQKMDEPHEFTDENLIEVLAVEPVKKIDHSERRKCPKCQDVIMMRHFFSVRKEVEVDECPKCAGFWLDEGELFQIRHQFQTEEERINAARQYFGDMFDTDLEKMKNESKEKAEKAAKIAKIFRLVSPRNYF
ncbi:conserved hypothetical protein [Desulfamplus magnetovallimortis]|uniref:Transcription factor zinc-finger domain-containing protein n=1 Tax=Desulfamplus magnetovallimortis TaxID=1246637 RepID=L0R6M7_9BACT|nr:zf-TFIIB domain-containing protein [Desulfamplus magnetovallimortis]CCO06656.1 conserved hypothetical protein [Desulfamplus magnetovallimortis BW-1]SLM32707.1 conserved hypothetical protein [Desulfamplus magnetovallimortis]